MIIEGGPLSLANTNGTNGQIMSCLFYDLYMKTTLHFLDVSTPPLYYNLSMLLS